jgi:hypothetical protein
MTNRNRPLGVTIIVIMYGITAAIVWLGLLHRDKTRQDIPLVVFNAVALSVAAGGLWNLRMWGRALTIVWASVAILYGFYTTPHALSAMIKGDPYPMAISLGRTVLHGAALVYLFQSKTAAAFNPRQSASIGIAPKNPV